MARKVAGKNTLTLPIPVPRFKSESEEADWWYANRAVIEEFLLARATWVTPDGKTLRGPSKMISIRLPEADIARAKKVAAQKGIGYQTYLRSVVHQALQDVK